jgi:RNA polymerase sigma-70 factor (ECF subfamily)
MHDAAARLAGLLVDDPQTLGLEFETRLAESSALAFRVAYGVLRQKQDAEDVAQEAFARAFRRFHTLRDRDRFRAWLVRMTWRLAIDHRRGAKRRVAREDAAAASPVHGPEAERDVLSRERSDRLWAAIDALPDKLRVVIVLAAIDGHGVRDVAQLLNVPEGTVKSRLFDARKRLQEQLT